MYGEQVEPEDPDTPEDPDAPGAGVIDRTDLDKEDPSNGRFKRWKHTVQIFLHSPIYGTSPRNVAAFAKEHAPDTLMALYGIAPHNGYLDVLVGTGALGMLTMLSFLVWMVVIIIKKIFSNRRNLIFAFSAATVFIFAGAAALISDVYMVFTLGSVFFWTLMGYAVNDEENTRESLISKLFGWIFRIKKA
jgi:O-antigen ligase